MRLWIQKDLTKYLCWMWWWSLRSVVTIPTCSHQQLWYVFSIKLWSGRIWIVLLVRKLYCYVVVSVTMLTEYLLQYRYHSLFEKKFCCQLLDILINWVPKMFTFACMKVSSHNQWKWKGRIMQHKAWMKSKFERFWNQNNSYFALFCC